MLTNTRTSNRLARKRKVAMIVDDPSDEEEERPKKKQKITKKSSSVPKKTNNRKKKKGESEESEEDISDSDEPKNNSKKKAADVDDDSYADDDESAEDADDWAVLNPRKKTDLAELKLTALNKLLASADSSAYQSLGEEEYTLPDELILQIFTGLTRKQLHAVGLTCRQWLRLTHDQSLGWHLAHSIVLLEDASLYFDHYKGKFKF